MQVVQKAEIIALDMIHIPDTPATLPSAFRYLSYTFSKRKGLLIEKKGYKNISYAMYALLNVKILNERFR